MGIREPTFWPLTCHVPLGKPLNLSGLQGDGSLPIGRSSVTSKAPATSLMTTWEFSGLITSHAHLLGLSTERFSRSGPQLRWGHPAESLPPALQPKLQAGRFGHCRCGEAEESAHCLLTGLPGRGPDEPLFLPL